MTSIVRERGEGVARIPMPRWEEFGTGFAASLEGLGVAELTAEASEGRTPQPLKTWTQPLSAATGREVRRASQGLDQL